MPSVGVVVAAGGRGKRLSGKIPKQFLRLGGVPILQRTVELFASIRSVDEIVIASAPEYVRKAERLLARIRCRKHMTIVPGGKERQDSVWNGMHGFFSKPDIVLVHDAARPLVPRKVILAVIDAAKTYGSAVVGVKVNDTTKVEGKKGFYTRTLDRDRLWAVQTPQGFKFDLLLNAHKAARRSRYLGTDEASLVERLGVPVRIVEGDRRNIKITTQLDFHLAEMWLKSVGIRR
ncbi:MAG: IspD [Bacteroidetes bacterium]|nr:IspD [Bacteroidota bacterium]